MSSLKAILKQIESYALSKGYDVEKIRKAFTFAEQAHEGQYRKSGESYIHHPVSVALCLTEYGADEASIIAAILHDVVEDTKYNLEDIEKEFGSEIAQLIDGLTMFAKNRFREADTLDRKIESLRKWFDIMRKDIRVAIIKLADRWHNLSTLDALDDRARQERFAKESLDLHVKIADKLGMQKTFANGCINENWSKSKK